LTKFAGFERGKRFLGDVNGVLHHSYHDKPEKEVERELISFEQRSVFLF